MNEHPSHSNHLSEGPTVIASFHPFFAIARAIQLRRTGTLPPQHDKWLYILEIEWRKRYKSSSPLSPLQPPNTVKKRKRLPDSEGDIPSPIRKRVKVSWEEQLKIFNAQSEPAIPRWRANLGNGSQTDGAFVPEELTTYRKEPSREPPTRQWSEWRPDWFRTDRAEKSESLDTRIFSSNDWAFYRSRTLLPGPADLHFQADPAPRDGPEASEHVTSRFWWSPTPSTNQSKW